MDTEHRFRRGDPHPSDPQKRFWTYQRKGDRVYANWCASPEAFDRAMASVRRGAEKWRSSENGRATASALTRRWRAANPAASAFSAKRAHCRANGIAFNLTVDDFAGIPETCPVLGIPLIRGTNGPGPADNAPSLDRIDPALGYVKGNVIWVSLLANRIKTNATPAQLIKVGQFYSALAAGHG